jgi:HlyD family secretion protein
MGIRPSLRRSLLLSALLIAGGVAILGYRLQRAEGRPTPLLGVVHETEIHIAPETNGRLESIQVSKGQRVRKGDVLAILSSPELSASVLEAKASSAQARADRDNVDAGVRKEEIDISAQNVQIGEANLALAQQQFKRADTLAAKDVASKQQLDQSTAALHKAEASLAQLRAIHQKNQAGPTAEERASARAKVVLSEAATADLEARLAKTRLVAPSDATVEILVATPGEVISPGQSIMTLSAERERWFTFTVREDLLGNIAIGSVAKLAIATGRTIAGRVTELRPLGEFATWRAARAVDDHDLNSFLVRVDPLTDNEGDLEPGMTVWLQPAADGK